jgi:predicted Zn-dependent peptidase
MIHFEEIVLANGLRILVHEDPSTPLAAVNLFYKVGARDRPKQNRICPSF